MKGRIVVIGASFGGIGALTALVARLPHDLPAALLVVQHTSPDGPGMLPRLLSNAGPLPAAHARDLESIEPGRIYVAAPDRHLLVRPGGYLHLSHGPKENRTRPAVDPTFRSAALVYGAATVGIVLTGHLDDGTAGLLAVKDRGGVTIVQEPHEATAPSMPTSALRHVQIDHRGTLAQIAEFIVELANDAPGKAAAADPLLEIEDRLAEGIFGVDDWRALEQRSSATALNCPDCRSALYELRDSRITRFRCRCGHAFTARALLSGQAEAGENLLAATYGALIEEATLARRWAASTDATSDLDLRDHLAARIARLERQAAHVCDWLGAATGER
jgi:two-component system chemotaxis response regulator CheB